MTSRIKQSEQVEQFCGECMTCFSGDPETCPECGAEQPSRGWDDLRRSPHPYLGKIVDGRYLLDRYIGGGASGRVYRAEDVKLNRPFALKILDLNASGGSSSESSLRRFENEVEALSRIRNPHVINIYESYRLEGETPAMLTEYIDGVTLEQMLEGEKCLEVDSALTLLRQVANGLHEAHGRGVIHRDIKPANVMIEQLPAAGSFARILDFGLVHLADNAGNTRGFWGTPLYAAPEQCAPGPPINATTDIYSLGCVLFHCIVGHPPFVREDPRAIMRAHVDEEPPRLGESADQPVPKAVDRIVASMLEKDQDDRPSDMSEIIEVMEPVTRSSGSWDRSLVTGEVGALADEESSDALELDEAAAQTADGTRIGVADTGAERPRIAQLLQSVDLQEKQPAFAGPVETTRLDRTGDCAVVSDSESRIFVMSTKGESYFQEFPPAEIDIAALAPDITRGRVFAAEAEGRILQWRLQVSTDGPSEVVRLDADLESLALGAQGQRIFLGTATGGVLCYDLRVGRTSEICRLAGTITGLHVSANAGWILASTDAGGVYAVRDGSDIVQLDTLEESVLSLELEPDSGVAAAIDSESRLRVFHVQQSFGNVTLAPDVENLRSVTIAPGNQILALSVTEPEIRIWRIRRERLEDQLPGFEPVEAASGRTKLFGIGAEE